jgi:cytochrome c biogenesis protein CcmG, thiol:disulfide interchange protein DsbE
MRARFVLAAAATLLAACAHAPGPPPPSAPTPLLGQETPAFRRPTVQGPIFDTAGARGRVLVVDFFAAYCRPCQRTLPALEALHASRPDVEIVGVSLDDGPEGAVAMIHRHHLTFPVVHDTEHVLAGRFRVSELPTSFVADAGGHIIWSAGPAQAASQTDDALLRAVTAAAGSP